MVTLYDTLGVRENAGAEEIKRAYRKAAMRAHPDRNVGREAAAHGTFQQIKEAYAILSDPEQRRVYDVVFAEEMRRLERRREAERRRAEAEAARREAEYAALVALAMRFAARGHNRDVVFGVLLGRECELSLAARIADSVAALQAFREEQPASAADSADTKMKATHFGSSGFGSSARMKQAKQPEQAENEVTRAENAGEPTQANLFSTLWHGMFGLR